MGAKAGLTGLHRLIHPRGGCVDRVVEFGDCLAQGIMLAQIQFEHEATVVRQPSMQRIGQDLGRRLDTPVGQRRQLVAVSTPAIIASIIRRPLTPMMPLITESSLMLASSSVFWIRWIWLVCSRVSCLRARSSERSSWVVWSGTKSRPDQPAGQQIGDPHVASFTSVFRPGTFLMCAGIGDDQLECAVAQDVPDRLPVDAGRLHRHVRAA